MRPIWKGIPLSNMLRTSLRLHRLVKDKMPGTLRCWRLPHTASRTSRRHLLISFRRWKCCSKCNRLCMDSRCSVCSEQAATCPHRCAANSKRADVPSRPAEVLGSIQQLSFQPPLHGLCPQLVKSSWDDQGQEF